MAKTSKAKSKTSPKRKVQAKAKTPGTRANSKQAQLIEMLKRPEGATIDEIVKKFDWQAHYADARIMPTCVGNPALRAVVAAMDAA